MWGGDEQLPEHAIPSAPSRPRAEKTSPAEVHLLQCSSRNTRCPKCIWERYYYWASWLQHPALCAYGPKIIRVSQQCGVLPLSLYFLRPGQHPMAPSRTLAHPSQPTLPSQIHSGSRWTCLLPMKCGKNLAEAAMLGSRHKRCSPLPCLPSE